MAAAVCNNLQHTVAGDNGAVEWFLMLFILQSSSSLAPHRNSLKAIGFLPFVLPIANVLCGSNWKGHLHLSYRNLAKQSR